MERIVEVLTAEMPIVDASVSAPFQRPNSKWLAIGYLIEFDGLYAEIWPGQGGDDTDA